MFYILDVADSTLCEGILVPNVLFNVVSTIITGIKIVVPILLIIWGMLDFAKSVVAKKEEDIKNTISKLTDEMLEHASRMEFEQAAELRDKIKELEKLINE